MRPVGLCRRLRAEGRLRSWKGLIVSAGRTLEGWFDRLRFGLKRRMGWIGPIEILPYRGHGTRHRLFLKGRVLEAVGILPSSAVDSWRRNVRNMVRRFLSSEIPHARVRANHGGHELEVVADEEGFFDLRFDLEEPLQDSTSWHPVEIELLWPRTGEVGVRARGSVLVPASARFGIISDLDDTVLRSSVTDVLRMARMVLLSNAHTRLPFEGVSDFYRALQRGLSGEDFNPIFYVSSSPWNLYDMLEDFLDVHGVPAGPLFLKDWSPTTLRDHDRHKLSVIRTLLATYTNLPFVLIGDSGERDPEIYHQVVHEHPGRVRAIYIRDVTTSERDAAVHAIADELKSVGVEMLLTTDTVVAAEHAVDKGLISPDALSALRE
jgi:phosphatidate phosphatase APP1